MLFQFEILVGKYQVIETPKKRFESLTGDNLYIRAKCLHVRFPAVFYHPHIILNTTADFLWYQVFTSEDVQWLLPLCFLSFL